MLKIFITDLDAYNQGYLVGEWVSLPLEMEELSIKIKDILENGKNICKDYHTHEEIFITDYEWDEVAVFEIEEYTNIKELNKEIYLLEEIEELDIVKFLLENHFCNDIEDAIDKIDNVVVYECQTMEQIAENFIEECYDLSNIPDIIASNIDYKSIARDLEIEGNFFEMGLNIYEYRD